MVTHPSTNRAQGRVTWRHRYTKPTNKAQSTDGKRQWLLQNTNRKPDDENPLVSMVVRPPQVTESTSSLSFTRWQHHWNEPFNCHRWGSNHFVAWCLVYFEHDVWIIDIYVQNMYKEFTSVRIIDITKSKPGDIHDLVLLTYLFLSTAFYSWEQQTERLVCEKQNAFSMFIFLLWTFGSAVL